MSLYAIAPGHSKSNCRQEDFNYEKEKTVASGCSLGAVSASFTPAACILSIAVGPVCEQLGACCNVIMGVYLDKLSVSRA